MTDINIKKIQMEQNMRRKNREKCFEIIKNMCLKKIALVSKIGTANSVLFKVPPFILGQPSYDTEKCIKYLVKKMQKRGFKTMVIDKTNILIYWHVM